MERPTVQPNGAENSLENLSKTFAAGGISPDNFLDKVLELDQADRERKSSLLAAEILSQPEIVEAFQETQDRTKFYSIRSLTFFHKAQIRLSKGEADVKDDFERALHDSLEVGPQNEDWANYIRATIAYLDGDLDSLRGLSEKIHLNKSLVQNFVKGLEERGHPDYLADYSKEREPDQM
ncbi:MAG: hypothetical protein JWN64_848 [Parcubacteria group bacterium]|nr:hypothetical protein [Parcubacteria group bacterium]